MRVFPKAPALRTTCTEFTMPMESITCLLIDDEISSLNLLAGLLDSYCPQVEIVGTYSDPLEGLKALPELAPDLLLLDIQMPLISGLDLVRIIGENRCQVVFVSAHQEYALEAIKLLPTDYLLKPVNPDDLIAAVHKVAQRRSGEGKAPPEESSPEQYIRIPDSDGFHLVHVPHIVRVEADNSYSTIVLNNGRSMVISRGIREFAPLLSSHALFRVHRSHIINLSFLQSYSTADGGTATLTNGDQVPVSRRRMKELKKRLDQWSTKLG